MTTNIKPAAGADLLTRLIEEAFERVTEAERIAHAGPGGPIYLDLLDAHSALLRAKNRARQTGRAKP